MPGGPVFTAVVHLSVVMAGCELVVAIRNETSLGTFLMMFPMASSASSNNGVATRMEALLHTAMDRNTLLP